MKNYLDETWAPTGDSGGGQQMDAILHINFAMPPIDVPVSFSMVGNICTFRFSNFSFTSSTNVINITANDPNIVPFLPAATFRKDIFISVSGAITLCTFLWDVDAGVITITIPTAGSNFVIGMMNIEHIIYDTLFV